LSAHVKDITVAFFDCKELLYNRLQIIGNCLFKNFMMRLNFSP
jgi:hypothetical protein